MLDVGFQNRPFIGSEVGKVSLFPLIVLDIFDDYFEFWCISTLEYHHHFLENMKDILLITFLNGRLLFRQGGFDYFHLDNYILVLPIIISRNKSAIFIILFSRNSFLSLIFLCYEFPRQEILKPITLYVCILSIKLF